MYCVFGRKGNKNDKEGLGKGEGGGVVNREEDNEK